MGTNDEKPEISDDDSDKASSSSRGGHTPTPASFSKSPSDEPSHIPVPSVPPQDTKNSSDSVPPPSTGQTPSSSQSQWDNFTTALIWIAIAVVVYYVLFSGNKTSKSSSENEDWRLLVDTKEHLSNEHRSMVRASLKPILDKSYTSQDNSISTLLILSSNEEVAAQLGRCLLPMVNSPSNTDQVNPLIRKFSLRTASFRLEISRNRSSETSWWQTNTGFHLKKFTWFNR